MYALPLHQNTGYPERLTGNFDQSHYLLNTAKSLIRGSRRQSMQQRFEFAKQVQTYSTQLENTSDVVFQSIKDQTVREIRQNPSETEVFIRAMSLVRHVIFKQTGLKAYKTQIVAASTMLDNCLAEMQTGEGKSLAILLAAGTAALLGLPVHVITANDYLAQRDAGHAADIFKHLNISVGVITANLEFENRHTEYKKDIVFSTARELIFDYLRDSVSKPTKTNTLHGIAQKLTTQQTSNTQVLRGLSFAIIDEADSILLDEATTPFVISAMGKQKFTPDHYQFAMDLAIGLTETEHFQIQKNHRKISLTKKGHLEIESQNKHPVGLWQVYRFRAYLVEQALSALHLFNLDQEYLIKDGEIVIVDMVTGRIADGRKWSQGIHQLIELKEGLEITDDQEQVIKMTYQEFFPRYLKLGGTSGTLSEDHSELNHSYGLPVVKIPLRLASQRKNLAEKLFLTREAKWENIVTSIQNNLDGMRPVLVTVGSVEDADFLSAQLKHLNIKHVTLNARQNAEEAKIISAAGLTKSVTIATNIAGRGTDIKLSDKSLKTGGLHIVRCHLNHSRRIDRQVNGRCARNGQPGTVETILAIDDPLTALYTPNWIIAVLRGVYPTNKPLPKRVSKLIIAVSQLRAKWSARRQRWRLKQNTRQARKLLAVRGTGY